MDTETFFLEKKYSKFTENMKSSLKKAIHRGNIELANVIKEYLDTIQELKSLHKLKKKNNIEPYRTDIKSYENKLEELQLKIIEIQFNKSSIYNKDKIVLDIPKYVNNDLNYIFMFIYKFVEINSDILCIVAHNIIDDLFNLNILKTPISDICPNNNNNIFTNISIVYNTSNKKIQYNYKIQSENTDSIKNKIKEELDKIIKGINDYDINKNVKTFGLEFNEKTIKEFKIMFATLVINLLRDANCPPIVAKETPFELFLKDKNELEDMFNAKLTTGNKKELNEDEIKEEMKKRWDTKIETEKTKYRNMVISKYKRKLTNVSLKQFICNYVKFNPNYNITKEYNLLYNHFLTRTLSTKKIKNNPVENANINIVLPHFSISFMNSLVVFMYIFIKNNKNDICENIMKVLTIIKEEMINSTYSSYDSGDYYYKQGKILSMCSTNPNAQKLINTFYSKYKEYDKVLISNLLLKIIDNNSLKIKYDMVKDDFEIVIINKTNLDINLKEIDESKLLEGLNEDLKCINENINKNFIIKILEITTQGINKVLKIITDEKIVTSIFNLSTNSDKIYTYLKDKKLNFKIRKLIVIIFIKFLSVHISKFYKDPYSTQYNMYETLINDIYKHLCETLTVEFTYNIFKKLDELQEEFPHYEI